MNRRSRVRFNTDMTVKVTCPDKPGTSIKGRLANLSAHGLSLILSSELPASSSVRVEWGSSDFEGQVIYCQPRGHEFLVGLEVEAPVYDKAKSSLATKSLS